MQTDHRPIGPCEGSAGAIGEGEELVGVAAVPGDEKLHRVGETNQGAGEQDELGHTVEMQLIDDVLNLEDLATNDHQGNDHGEAGENGAGHEVGRKNRRMPTRQL